MHAAWRAWFGHDTAFRDQARKSEKDGVGRVKALYPRGASDKDKTAQTRWLAGVNGATAGSGSTIPCELDEQGKKRFDIEPFEFGMSGSAAISDAINTAGTLLSILFLGHNLTTEVKGGSYAAAGVGEYIRDDIKVDDSSAEDAWAGTQLLAPWAQWNFGDPSLAPHAIYVTDSPSVNQARAQALQALGQFIASLVGKVPDVDIKALLEQFGVPMLAQGKAQVAMPTAVEPAPAQQDPEESTP